MKKEEILADCIEEVRSGKRTLEECLARYPELAGEMRPVLEIASRIKPENVTPSPEFRQRAKMYLIEKMEESPKISSSFWFWPKQIPARVLLYVLTGLVVLSAAGSGTVYAAQSSLPGDPLYVVKTGVENLQLALTTDAAVKAGLHLELAARRVDEATRQVELNRDIDVQALETIKQQYNGALKELSNLDNPEVVNNTLSKMSAQALDQQLALEQLIANSSQSTQQVLEQTINEARRSSTIAEVGYSNREFLNSHPSVTDEELDKGKVKLDGTLISIRDKAWNVGGTIIENVYYSGKVPQIGSRVRIEGMVKNGKLYLTDVTESESSTGLKKVEGQFGGPNLDGTSSVGGISVQIGDDDNSQLKPGDKVQLQGDEDDSKLKITGKESQERGDQSSPTLNGILTAVSTANHTITVKVTGNQITVNVSEAKIEIKERNSQKSSLSDLSRHIGQNVRVEQISKINDTLYAKQVRLTVED
jgi:hypothetical protein